MVSLLISKRYAVETEKIMHDKAILQKIYENLKKIYIFAYFKPVIIN